MVDKTGIHRLLEDLYKKNAEAVFPDILINEAEEHLQNGDFDLATEFIDTYFSQATEVVERHNKRDKALEIQEFICLAQLCQSILRGGSVYEILNSYIIKTKRLEAFYPIFQKIIDLHFKTDENTVSRYKTEIQRSPSSVVLGDAIKRIPKGLKFPDKKKDSSP